MNFKITLPFALALCFTSTGCYTETYLKSQGTVVNLRNGKPPEIIQIEANGDGNLRNGSAFRLYSFDFCDDFNPRKPEMNLWQWEDTYLFAIFYPTNAQRQMLHTKTGSYQIYAWLMPNDLPEPPLEKHFKYLNLLNDAILTPAPNFVEVEKPWEPWNGT
jgi:hypothetical protein